jgi:hypothetical protein
MNRTTMEKDAKLSLIDRKIQVCAVYHKTVRRTGYH